MPKLSEKQLEILAAEIPEAPRSPKGGRPPADKK